MFPFAVPIREGLAVYLLPKRLGALGTWCRRGGHAGKYPQSRDSKRGGGIAEVFGVT